MVQRTGGCLCGKLRYTLESDNKGVSLCHCTHCQKVSGSAFSVNLLVDAAGLHFSGAAPTVYEDDAESGRKLRRLFCAQCGSSIASEADMFPGKIVLKVGTLDDTSDLAPVVEIWRRSAQHWVTPREGIIHFDKGRV